MGGVDNYIKLYWWLKGCLLTLDDFNTARDVYNICILGLDDTSFTKLYLYPGMYILEPIVNWIVLYICVHECLYCTSVSMNVCTVHLCP